MVAVFLPSEGLWAQGTTGEGLLQLTPACPMPGKGPESHVVNWVASRSPGGSDCSTSSGRWLTCPGLSSRGSVQPAKASVHHPGIPGPPPSRAPCTSSLPSHLGDGATLRTPVHDTPAQTGAPHLHPHSLHIKGPRPLSLLIEGPRPLPLHTEGPCPLPPAHADPAHSPLYTEGPRPPSSAPTQPLALQL